MGLTKWVAAAACGLLLGVSAQAAPVSGQGTWETTLKGRDISGNPVPLLVSGAPNPATVFVYDTVLNLTWLANWNAGAGSSFDDGVSTTDGRMTWSWANAWAAALNVGGFSGWALPGVLDIGNDGCSATFPGTGFAGGADCGYNVYTGEVQRRGSPLAHMFYDTLGNLAFCPPGDTACAGGPQTGWGLTNTGPFSNMQSDYYWSGTAYAPDPTSDAWSFNTNVGGQNLDDQYGQFYAVAVRPGDVFAGSVPEPGGLAMLLTGLGALAVARRRRTR